MHLCVIFVSVVVHCIRQNILACAGKSVDLLHVNEHLLACLLFWVPLSAEVELGFGKWAVSMLSYGCMRWKGQESAPAQSGKLYLYLFCFWPSSLKFVKTGISWVFSSTVSKTFTSSLLCIWYLQGWGYDTLLDLVLIVHNTQKSQWIGYKVFSVQFIPIKYSVSIS